MALNTKNKSHDSFKKQLTLRSIKIQGAVTYILKLLKLKRLTMLNVTEDTEHLKLSYIVGGNEKYLKRRNYLIRILTIFL